MAQKNNGSRKIGRHARIKVVDTILRDEQGSVMSHLDLMNRLGLRGGFVFAHGTPQPSKKRAN